jgi:diaminohydroxyphosphoribosylaminopyrimidine deaminase/5-amino-6-(5-phosphoribosylamino)uracil reductase
MVAMSPVRVLLDSRLRLPVDSRLVQTARETPLWIFAHAPASSAAALRAQGAEVIQMEDKDGLGTVLQHLGSRGITRLMIEGGPTLASALLADDLVDEAVLFHSATTIGEGGLPALDPRAQTMLHQHLKHSSTESVGPDRQDHYQRESVGDV